MAGTRPARHETRTLAKFAKKRFAASTVDYFDRKPDSRCWLEVWEQPDENPEPIWREERIGQAISSLSFDRTGKRLAIAGVTRIGFHASACRSLIWKPIVARFCPGFDT